MHSADDPDQEKFPFAGWIPTANGRLSFRHIGEAKSPFSLYANVATDGDQGERFILAFENRQCDDASFGQIVRPFRQLVGQLNGSFWYVFAAKSDGNPIVATGVEGQIFLFKLNDEWHKEAQSCVWRQIRELNRLRRTFVQDKDQEIVSNFNVALECLQRCASVKFHAVVRRTGEVFLSYPSYSDARLQERSDSFAAQHGYDFGEWMANQAYFFLRDISHRHQHHDHEADTILVLQPRGRFDRVAWRANVIYSLHHHIITTKRDWSPASIAQALGVLAYCKSFRMNCARILKEDIKDIPEFNEGALEASLYARIKEAEIINSRSSERAAHRGVHRIFNVTLAAIFAALMIMFVQPADTFSRIPYSGPIAGFIATYFWYLLGLLVFVLCVLPLSRLQMLPVWDQDISVIATRRPRAWVWALSVLTICVGILTIWIFQLAAKDLLRAFLGMLTYGR